MDRRLSLGIVLVVGLVSSDARPEAARREAEVGSPFVGPVPSRVPVGQATFSFGWEKNEPTLRVEGRGVKFFKRVGRDKVALRVEVPGDVVELEAEMTGAVRIGRKGRFLQLQMKDNFDAGIAKAQKLMAGSKALDGFEGLIASLGSTDTPQTQSLRSSHALLSAVRGVTVAVPSVRISGPQGRPSRAAFTGNAEGPGSCWEVYAATVNAYNYEFNDCIESYWWIPGWTAACGFQFFLQSELAFFWLLSCSGGIPV